MNKLLFDLNELIVRVRRNLPVEMQYPCGSVIDIRELFPRRTPNRENYLYTAQLTATQRDLIIEDHYKWLVDEKCFKCGNVDRLSRITDEEFLQCWQIHLYWVSGCSVLRNYINTRVSELTS